MFRRITRVLPDLTLLSYEDRLHELKLTMLLYRRNRYDMILTYKILSREGNINPESMYTLSDTTTRGHSRKLNKPRSLKTFRLNSFCVRTIDKWNSLTEDVVNASNVLTFKTRYDRLYRDIMQDTSAIYN